MSSVVGRAYKAALLSDAGPEKRSFEKIERSDLERLAAIARNDIDKFFVRNPQYAVYRARVIALALCQGAAEHYVRGSRGVHDFDVWGFFRAHPSRALPYRRRLARYDFGSSKFGRDPGEPQLVGRRVDVMMRSIPAADNEDAATAIRRYLTAGKRDSSPWHLAQRPVVVIYPEAELGRVIWDKR